MTSNPMIPNMTLCDGLPLGACGDTKMDRGLSGAGIGAAAGAVGGALLGNPGGGALLGGAVGVAFTDKEQIDLGRPAWK